MIFALHVIQFHPDDGGVPGIVQNPPAFVTPYDALNDPNLSPAVLPQTGVIDPDTANHTGFDTVVKSACTAYSENISFGFRSASVSTAYAVEPETFADNVMLFVPEIQLLAPYNGVAYEIDVWGGKELAFGVVMFNDGDPVDDVVVG